MSKRYLIESKATGELLAAPVGRTAAVEALRALDLNEYAAVRALDAVDGLRPVADMPAAFPFRVTSRDVTPPPTLAEIDALAATGDLPMYDTPED